MTTHRMEKNLTIASVGEDVEKLESSYTTGKNVKWHSCFDTKFGNSSND